MSDYKSVDIKDAKIGYWVTWCCEQDADIIEDEEDIQTLINGGHPSEAFPTLKDLYVAHLYEEYNENEWLEYQEWKLADIAKNSSCGKEGK